MGLIISISNQKGGVGKTTTAINLSASLSVMEKSCLLIDCDPQGNATTGLGYEKREISKGVYHLLFEEVENDEVILETALRGLYLIASDEYLIGAEVEMAEIEKREYLLRERVSSLRDRFDYIFIDCPPSLGFLTLNALTAADQVLIPLQCEYYALEGLGQIFQTINAVKKGLNPDLRLAGILLTMYDIRNNLSWQVEEEAKRHFKGLVFDTKIPRNVRLSEAPSYGKPALLYDIRSKGAQSYLALAKEFIKRGGK